MGDEVGSVGEEAAKLFAALQGLARETGQPGQNGASHAGSGATGSGIGAAAAAVNAHLANGEACRYCPLCQVISHVRTLSPEVKSHLNTAATSLLGALNAALATSGPGHGSGRADRSRVERIDLGDEPDQSDPDQD